MAIRTSQQSGRWTEAATWGGTVPVDGDSVVIQAGHVVEFDANLSAWAGGIAGITLAGTLRASTVPGDYVLKLAGHMTPGADGRLEAGTEAAPYPADCTFEIQLNGDVYAINGGENAVALYGQVPASPVVRLTANASAGQTALPVDIDVTGDLWRAGDTLVICDIDRAREYELYTLAAAAPGEIVLTTGLVTGKLAEAVVVLAPLAFCAALLQL